MKQALNLTGIALGFMLGLFILATNVFILGSYLLHPVALHAYSNVVILTYAYIPSIILCSFLWAIVNWRGVNRKRLYQALIIVDLILVVTVQWFLYVDANKVLITINNLSTLPITNTRIVARNSQNLTLGEIGPRQQAATYCDCRAIVWPGEGGIELQYDINQRNIRAMLAGPNNSVFDDTLEIRIVSDTVSFLSEEYAGSLLWGRLEKGPPDGLREWKDVHALMLGLH